MFIGITYNYLILTTVVHLPINPIGCLDPEPKKSSGFTFNVLSDKNV